MKMAPMIQVVVFISFTIFLSQVNGDYNCVCNYNVEIGVLESPSDQSQTIGDLYEFDCKEHIESMDSGQWLAVAYDHKIGYVQQDAQTQQQICPGEPPSEDKVTTTTLVTTPLTTTTVLMTTESTTTPSTTSSTTTPTTTSSTTTPPTTSSTTTPTTTSSTTTPTTTSSTTSATTTSSTTTPTTSTSTTTQSTTPTTTPTPTTTTRTTVITTPPTQSTTTSTTPSPTTITTHSTQTTTMRTNIVSGKPKLCTAQLQTRVQNDRNILTQYDNSCYEIVSSGISTWTDADTHCKTYGGHLVSINSQGEQLFITNFLKHNFFHEVWTGLNDNTNENTFVWTSGEPVTLTNWNPNRVDPDPVLVGHQYQDCVVLSPSNNGLWDDRICPSTHNYICEYGEPNLCPINLRNRINNAGTLLTQYRDLCYETVISSMKTWNQAEQYCNNNGGHLVTIDSAGKQTFITNYLHHDVGHTIWIGLTDSENEGHFEWASGKFLVNAHWNHELFPHYNDGSEDCAVMIQDYAGHWDDRICTSTHYFMCEYRLDGISMVTTPAPTVHVTYATIDPSNLDVPGDLNRCPSTLRSQSHSDQGVLGYYQNSCYELMPSKKVNYQNAEQMCTHHGGKLVDILSSHEQAFLQAFLERYSPQHAAWIGLHDMVNENYFQWMSGSPVSYTNWLPGHTSNFENHRQEDCVVIIPYKNGLWDDIPCGSYGGFLFGGSSETHPPLCEYKLSGNSAGNVFIG